MPGPYHVIVNNTPPDGWRYQVFDANGHRVASGTAKSEAEAKALGEKQVDELSRSD